MAKHLYIYVGNTEPRDKEAFLWIRKKPNGVLSMEIYNGLEWKVVTDSSVAENNLAALIQKLYDAADKADEVAEIITYPPMIGEDGYWYFYNVETKGYEKSSNKSKGENGTSISSVEQTITSTEPGGINVITVTLTNGQTFNFQVKNGDAAGQVNADWNATSGKAEILNKPDLSQFITKTVNDLTNYYLKSQTYSKTEVEQLIAAITALRFVSVAVLPTASAATMNKIYLVPSSDPQQQNVKDEYFTTENAGVYDWEKFGSTAMSLDGYVTTDDLNTALASYVTSSAFNTALAAKQDVISDLATIRSGAAAGATAYQKPNTGIHQSDLAAALVAIIQKAVANVSSNEDGAVVITLVNGDTYTIDLNHTHPDKQDLLVSGTNIKTVNNNSLLGSGNITITGEPGPAGESAINALVNHAASETVVTGLAWDTTHVFPEMASLDFGIATAPSDGYEHELVVIFDTPSDITNFALAVPSTIHWGNNINLANNISASTRYEVRITSTSLIAVYTESSLSS